MTQYIEKITKDIYEAQKSINKYDENDFSYCVAVFPDGDVSVGDLCINDNTWSQWHETPIVSFRVRPIYTSEDMIDAEDDPENPGHVAIWDREADYAAKRYAEELADAICNGKPIDSIFPQIDW